MTGRQRTTLRHNVDRDVYQIVKKLESDGEGNRRSRLTVTSVYESIKASNSSLARQKRRPLEDSIERVLTYRKEELKADEDGGDSDEALERDIAAAEAKAAAKRERDAFLLNRQMTKHWDFGGGKAAESPSGTSAPSDATAQPTGAISGTEATPANMEVDEPVERLPNGEPKLKRKRRTRSVKEAAAVPEVFNGPKLEDMGGISQILEALEKPLVLPLRMGEEYARMGHKPQAAILLNGPSGTGKTAVVRALADTLQCAFVPVSATSLVSGISGESEKNIREAFDEAIRLAPCLLFLDEVDVVAGKMDGAQKAMEVRMSSEISQGLDKIVRCTSPGRNVVVIAATNRPDSIEPTVRRRFQELEMSMPDEAARESILRTMTRNKRLSDDVDFTALARLTPGYVGADLATAVDFAASEAMMAVYTAKVSRLTAAVATGSPSVVDRIRLPWTLPAESNEAPPIDNQEMQLDQNDEDICITFAHLKQAIARIQPAAKREGFSTVPNTTWSEVGALQNVRKKLEYAIVQPIERPEKFAALGIKPSAGILLWGPPGCGKTLVAKAVANASKANFISIKGPELLNKYVGESEYNVRQLFSRAKSSAPCILFFDELDALVPTRDFTMSGATSRVVNALLTELDGVGDRQGIYVIGATNRPDSIDEAIRRPGRLGTDIYVGLPTPEDRFDILRTIYETTVPGGRAPDAVRKTIERVARDPRCGKFTGADLRQLLTAASEACMIRVQDDEAPMISEEDWERALDEVKPSVKDIDKYMEAMK
ncbi:Ribosome biogenesis ATPase rix7 [Pyricularia oryzae]